MNVNFENKDEYHKRLERFAQVDAHIQAHNKKHPPSKFKMDHNPFSTMYPDELKKMRGETSMWSKHMNVGGSIVEVATDASLPASVNWKDAGAVNPVKNQGQCGSCYTFGSTAVVEASAFINGNDLPNLSEQQIVSCSQGYGNMGCNGGYQPYVFQYLSTNYQVSYSQYPYVSGDGVAPSCNTTDAASGTFYVTANA
jgi:cathepsin L